MSTAQQRRLEAIRNDLFSGDDTRVAKAISSCEVDGSPAMVEPLLAFYASNAPESLRSRVASMLGALKVSNVEIYFLQALSKAEWMHIRKDIIGFMWSTGLQPVDAVSQISELAALGDYALTLECLTLLESIEDPIPEEQLLESIAVVHKAISESAEGDFKKLLNEYMNVLNYQRAQSDLNG
jgi:HEAT repeat protein